MEYIRVDYNRVKNTDNPQKKKKKKFSTRDRKTTKKTYNYHKIYVPSQFSTSDDGYSFRVNKWCDFVFRGLD